MSKGLSKNVAVHLEKAKDSTIAAVDCYNRCGTKFRSGTFIVLMCISWTSLFHAIFFKRKIKPCYRESDSSNRFKRIDGDYKAWGLSTCMERYYQAQTNPITENLRFLIGLRNKIEHRSMPELDNHVFGECQACLINFEEIIFLEFGTKHGLTECLSLAIQFSRLRSTIQKKAITQLQKPLTNDVGKYIETFRSSLTPQITANPQYSFKLFLIPKLTNTKQQSDLAVEFVKFDPTKPEEMAQYEKITALVRPSQGNVVNAGKLKPGDVCRRVEPTVKAAVGPTFTFNASSHHPLACRFYKIKPKKGDANPEKTDLEMCQYDAAHKD